MVCLDKAQGLKNDLREKHGMKLIVDSREQAPFTFADYDCEVLAGTLTTGDYSLAGL